MKLETKRKKSVAAALAAMVITAALFSSNIGRADELPPAPVTEKTVVSNGDGSYQLTLSVTGATASQDPVDANVVVIMDRSSGMSNDSKTGAKKIDVEIAAVKKISELIETNNVNDESHVHVAVVDYGGTANLSNFGEFEEEGKSWTDSKSDFEDYVNNVSVDSVDITNSYSQGRNWEAALSGALVAANAMQRTDEKGNPVPTYIVFLSQGDPTLRQTAVYPMRSIRYFSQNRDPSTRKPGDNSAWTRPNLPPYGSGWNDPNSNNYEQASSVAKKSSARAITFLRSIFLMIPRTRS